MSNNSVRVIFIIGLIVSLAIMIFPIFVEIQSMEKIEHTSLVTDKWSYYRTMFTMGNHIYKIELDNTTVKEVTDYQYHNLEIGDTFTYYKLEVVE